MKRLYGYLKKAMATKDKKKLTAVMEALSINNLLKDKMSRSLFQAEPAMRGILSSTSFEENDDGEVETEAQSRAVAEKAKMLEGTSPGVMKLTCSHTTSMCRTLSVQRTS